MPAEITVPSRKAAASKMREGSMRDGRLRKHADYQRVYREGKRQSLPLMTYFYAIRPPEKDAPQLLTGSRGPRIGLTAGRVLGNAVKRNRIKRRMREAIRMHREELMTDVDVILHPRRTVLEAEFSQIERDVLRAFRAVQTAVAEAARVKAGDAVHAHGR